MNHNENNFNYITKGNKIINPKDRGTDTTWNIPKGAFDSLQLNLLDQTWSYAPGNSMPIIDRMNNTDNSLIGNFQLRKDVNINYNYRNIDGYHVLDIVPVDLVRKESAHRKVEYRYNDQWFRCDQFTKNHDGLHIVFSGCSNTEGIGQNIEETWSYRLYQDIAKEHKTSGYFNLGRSGTGWQKILNNFRVYVDTYGAPDYLFVLHPNLLRGFRWVDNGNNNFVGWELYQLNPWQEKINKVEDLEFHRNVFPVWAMTWKLFTEYCKAIGTKIIWSTWDQWENDNIKNSGLFEESFIEIKDPTKEEILNKYYDLLDREDAIEARDGHDGYIHHTHWLSIFKQALINEGLLKND
jgi:hypothetical protein